LACLAIAVPGLAQWGHPLKGGWSGEWRETLSKTHRLLIEFQWEGKYGINPEGGILSGTLDPGEDGIPLKNLTLTPPKGGVANGDAPWALHFEAEMKGADGKPVKVVVDGFLENLGSYKRIISGIWQEGDKKGPFKIESNYGL
jgi:hypothetical protein